MADTASRTSYAHLSVMPEELLFRDDQIVYGHEARALHAGKRILVTGAGGSIGSEIVRQLHTLHPGAVYMLDHDESAMHSLQLELNGHGLLDDDTTVLADIRDRDQIARLFAEIKPDIVYHAAAHKHLPLLERHPGEGVKTNIAGTHNVISAAVAVGVERFINISTDKAASPTSVLGATKRLAEMIVASYAGSDARVASVRFGNVLGSRGSFLHSLAYQIDNGRPVTITDPDVTRFFMTIPEAAGLVIESAVMASAGETYVLDMGEPVRILDLVTRYAALAGRAAPDIVFTGLRPGEKLHEELLDDAEVRDLTAHPRVWAMRAKAAIVPNLMRRISAVHHLAEHGTPADLKLALQSVVPAGARTADRELAGAA